MSDWLLDVFVPGLPAPQGSKDGYAISRGKGTAKIYTGRVRMVESSKKVKPWRGAVDAVCRQLWAGREPLDGPLLLDVEFLLPRLKAAPKSRPGREPHTVYPDLSKLVRSTEDAMKTGGVWADDARVAHTVSSKWRAALNEPTGARIRVARWEPAQPAGSRATTRICAPKPCAPVSLGGDGLFAPQIRDHGRANGIPASTNQPTRTEENV